MREQRFLGEILVRRGVVAGRQLEGLYTVAAGEGRSTRRPDRRTRNIADEAQSRRALADEAELRSCERLEPTNLDRARDARADHLREDAQLLVVAEDEHAVHVVVRRSVRHAGARRPARRSSESRSRSRRGRRERSSTRSTAFTRREAGGGELETDDANVDEEAASDILDSDDEAPVIRWVNSLFLQAMKERASDIHIEPEEKEVLVRYRIDGELYVAVARRAPFMNSIVSRIKIESSLNIAEKRLPQDGRITKKIAGKSFDIRVSHHPDEPRLRADRHASPEQVERPARPAGPRLLRRATTR